MSYGKYYNLADYLFDEVGPKFRKDGVLDPVDLYLLLIWKANRAKNKTKNRLSKSAGSFSKAAESIATALRTAEDNKGRLCTLMTLWGFRLPTASSLLAVLYPEEFTVYDVRVCSQLGKFKELVSWRFSDDLWLKYKDYCEAVNSAVHEDVSLKDKDRYLWGKSLYEDARENCA